MTSGDKQFSIIYETKNENMEGLCLSWAQVNKGVPVSHRERVLLCSKLFPRTQKSRERPLNVSVFQEYRAGQNSTLWPQAH